MKRRAIIIGFLIELSIAVPFINLKIKNDELEKENARLQQQVFDYKWQLEQVEWIFRTME